MERLIGKREWPSAPRPRVRRLPQGVRAGRRPRHRTGHRGQAQPEDVRRSEGGADLEPGSSRSLSSQRPAISSHSKNPSGGSPKSPACSTSGPIERAISEIETYPGTSVGDLIAFMQKHNLRFGVADSPTENALYASLFTNLVQQREQVTLPPDRAPVTRSDGQDGPAREEARGSDEPRRAWLAASGSATRRRRRGSSVHEAEAYRRSLPSAGLCLRTPSRRALGRRRALESFTRRPGPASGLHRRTARKGGDSPGAPGRRQAPIAPRSRPRGERKRATRRWHS